MKGLCQKKRIPYEVPNNRREKAELKVGGHNHEGNYQSISGTVGGICLGGERIRGGIRQMWTS